MFDDLGRRQCIQVQMCTHIPMYKGWMELGQHTCVAYDFYVAFDCCMAHYGRSPITTHRIDRSLVLFSRRNRLCTARALEIDFRRATAVHLSCQTVMNRLHGDCMRARRPVRRNILTAQHRAVRFNLPVSIITGSVFTGGQILHG